MGDPSDLYKQIIERHPSPGTLVLILEKLKEEGRYSTIAKTCLKALELYPDEIRIRSLLADAYRHMGFLGQAEAQWEKVTGAIDELVNAYKHQAMLYARQDRIEEALRSLRLYLAHHPQDEDPLALFTDSGGEQASLHEAIDRELASATLAEIYVRQGRIQDAIETYERVVQKKADDQASRDRLAELRTMLEREQTPSDTPRAFPKSPTQRTIDMLEAWLAAIREHYA